jgi:hypothetical protein
VTVVHVLAARGLPGVPVRFECRHDRVDVARRERPLVLADDVRLAQLRVGLEQGRASGVAAGKRPAAEVHPQLVDPSVRLLVGDDRDRKIDPPPFSVQVQNHLLEAVPLADEALDVLGRGVALREPTVHFGDIRLERTRALDASAYGVV